MKKLSSYQRLKQRMNDMRDYQLRLLNDPEFYMTEYMTNEVKKAVDRQLFFGDSGPTGHIDLNNLFK